MKSKYSQIAIARCPQRQISSFSGDKNFENKLPHIKKIAYAIIRRISNRKWSSPHIQGGAQKTLPATRPASEKADADHAPTFWSGKRLPLQNRASEEVILWTSSIRQPPARMLMPLQTRPLSCLLSSSSCSPSSHSPHQVFVHSEVSLWPPHGICQLLPSCPPQLYSFQVNVFATVGHGNSVGGTQDTLEYLNAVYSG